MPSSPEESSSLRRQHRPPHTHFDRWPDTRRVPGCPACVDRSDDVDDGEEDAARRARAAELEAELVDLERRMRAREQQQRQVQPMSPEDRARNALILGVVSGALADAAGVKVLRASVTEGASVWVEVEVLGHVRRLRLVEVSS